VSHSKNPFGALPEMVKRTAQVWSDKSSVLAPLAEGADLLLAGMTEQRLAASVAQYHDIPLVALHFFPALCGRCAYVDSVAPA
jgi:hypothetical protein